MPASDPPSTPATPSLTLETSASTPPGAPKKGARAKSAGAKPSKTDDPVGAYGHDATRTNNPPAGLIEFEKKPATARKTYAYDPHLDPQLQWSGKSEHTSFEVETVSLHIHERVSTEAILRTAKREDAQKSLFGAVDLAPEKAVDFYRHEVDWANRLVLGDSLLVMNSLLEREQMRGKVQCVYMDPPYGVKFNSNFQPSISRRDVKDGDDGSLTREPEQIQAYRDTWTLGVHSYLTYLRDRLLVARDLLHESGSVFVQISDDNVHHVREVMDEVFGAGNFVSLIPVVKTAGLGASGLPTVCDYLLWFARNRDIVKFRQLYTGKEAGDPGSEQYGSVQLADGSRRRLTGEERAGAVGVPTNARVFRLDNLTSGAFRQNTTINYEFDGRNFHPGQDKCWKTTREGLDRLTRAGRIAASGNTLTYVRFIDDFPAMPLKALWTDTGTGGFGDEKIYVVQTTTKVIARCILMTTDPGDLVLDPTCGSGTTAYVAEQWGRRWITTDTSRVALSLARARLMTAKFPFYRLRSTRVRDGFQYKTVPHITLGSIAQNTKLDALSSREEIEREIRKSAEQEVLYDQPEEDKGRVRVSGPFTVEAIPVASLGDPGDTPVAQLEPGERDDDLARGSVHPTAATSASAGEYVTMMIDLLRKTGVHLGAGSAPLSIPNLRAVKGAYEYFHAEGEALLDGNEVRVAVSFGSRHGPVTATQVVDGEHEMRGHPLVVFAGFACDPQARKMIDEGTRHTRMLFANAAPDILVGDLLKSPKTSKLFTVFGAPDVTVHAEANGLVSVELAGVDLYDPNTGETRHAKGSDVAAWFVDHDYDGRSFCVCQAHFPSGATKHPWEKLQRALKGTIDESAFEAMRGTRSLPFKAGRKVAVTVVDDRGNEVVKVVGV